VDVSKIFERHLDTDVAGRSLVHGCPAGTPAPAVAAAPHALLKTVPQCWTQTQRCLLTVALSFQEEDFCGRLCVELTENCDSPLAIGESDFRAVSAKWTNVPIAAPRWWLQHATRVAPPLTEDRGCLQSHFPRLHLLVLPAVDHLRRRLPHLLPHPTWHPDSPMTC